MHFGAHVQGTQVWRRITLAVSSKQRSTAATDPNWRPRPKPVSGGGGDSGVCAV